MSPSTPSPEAGLIDLQVNGFAGVDFQQDDIPLPALEHAMRALRRHRTSRILYTLITARIDTLCRRLAYIESLRARSPLLREMIAGYHLEGPWLSPEPGYHGAHNPTFMTPARIPDADRLIDASAGNIRLVTIAPESDGADALTAHLVSRGVCVSAGHCNASEDDIDRAISAGLTLCTHLGNAVPALLHRHDNVVQRLLARDELTAVFIPDGIHLPIGVLRNFVRAKPPGKVLFTTDCMAAAGSTPGRYTLGRHTLAVDADGIVREPGRETFAGSSLTMDRAEKNVADWLGWNVTEAHAACSERVAAAVGLCQMKSIPQP